MHMRIVSLFLVFLFLALPASAVERPSAGATFTPGGAAKPAAQGFVAGTRGVACGDAYYCIESDGVYRFDGGHKSLACAGYFDVNGSIVTDGAEMYVTQQRQAGVNVLRIDLATGETAFAAGFGPELSSLAGVIDGALYALCWDADNDWEGPSLYRVDLASGESQLLSSHLGGAQLWKDNLILHGFRTDVGPSVYLTLDGAGNTGVICQTALGGQGLEDGIYYWACAPDENGIWDWMELRQIGAEGARAILTVNCPGASAYGGQFLQTCATFLSNGGGMRQYMVDYETGAAVDCTLPDGNSGAWFEEDSQLYAYSYTEGALYRYREGAFSAAAQIGQVSVLGFHQGYLYYAAWEGDTTVQAVKVA